jgi:hypothetical protein
MKFKTQQTSICGHVRTHANHCGGIHGLARRIGSCNIPGLEATKKRIHMCVLHSCIENREIFARSSKHKEIEVSLASMKLI